MSATTAKPSTTLLLIDLQKDFHPGGSLAIPTANKDAKRIVDFIRSNSHKITRIVATFDSHHKFHIANPHFWVSGKKDDAATHPKPFTIITAQNIKDGDWKPNPSLRIPLHADGIVDPRIFKDFHPDASPGSYEWLCAYALEYAQRLEAKGRFQLCIWPEHCLMGSPGHAIVDDVFGAFQEWCATTGGTVEWVYKGQNLFTEMYSALEAEVPVSESNSFNKKLQASLASSDRLLIGGQAMSHCVNYTTRDIVRQWPSKDKSNIILLTDCGSPVVGFEAEAEQFKKDMQAEGVTLSTSKDAL